MAADRLRVVGFETIRTNGIGCENRTKECAVSCKFKCFGIGQIEQNAFRARAVIALNVLTVKFDAACRNRQVNIAARDIDDDDAVIGNNEIN